MSGEGQSDRPRASGEDRGSGGAYRDPARGSGEDRGTGGGTARARAARRRGPDSPGAPLTALRALAPELRHAGIAAAALALTMVLPWYEKSYFDRGVVHDNLSAFEVFSFVEAAVLLVAAATMYLVWSRAQRRGFHLPGGDGVAITLAGGWAELLLVWRLFDKPDTHEQATIGIQWGMFAAMVAAGALIAAGARVRAAHRPEPPNPAEDLAWERPARHGPRDATRAPRDPTAVTQALGDRPAWEGEVREPPARTRPARGGPPPDEPQQGDRLF